MAAQYIDIAYNATDDEVAAVTVGGAVTNDVRVVYDETDPPGRTIAALQRAEEIITRLLG